MGGKLGGKLKERTATDVKEGKTTRLGHTGHTSDAAEMHQLRNVNGQLEVDRARLELWLNEVRNTSGH